MKVDVARLYAFGWKVAGRVPESFLRGVFTVVADVTWLRRTDGVVSSRRTWPVHARTWTPGRCAA